MPLLYVRGDYAFLPHWHLQVEADALAGGPGRAEDFSLKAAYDIDDRWSVAGGYRTIEGGVDIDNVYNFAWFNGAVASFTNRWGHLSP